METKPFGGKRVDFMGDQHDLNLGHRGQESINYTTCGGSCLLFVVCYLFDKAYDRCRREVVGGQGNVQFVKELIMTCAIVVMNVQI